MSYFKLQLISIYIFFWVMLFFYEFYSLNACLFFNVLYERAEIRVIPGLWSQLKLRVFLQAHWFAQNSVPCSCRTKLSLRASDWYLEVLEAGHRQFTPKFFKGSWTKTLLLWILLTCFMGSVIIPGLPTLTAALINLNY